MTLNPILAVIVTATAMLLSTASLADAIIAGDLTITQVQARATPPGALTTGGYLTIKNNGVTDDTLIGASALFAGKTEVHEMKMDGEIMKMRRLENGLPIPAGKEVKLESGGYHLMFMRLQQALKPGETVSGTLQFANAGAVPVEFEITAIPGHKMKQHGHGMKHGKENTSDSM